MSQKSRTTKTDSMTREEKNKEVVKGIFELINTLNNLKKISPEIFYAVLKAVI